VYRNRGKRGGYGLESMTDTAAQPLAPNRADQHPILTSAVPGKGLDAPRNMRIVRVRVVVPSWRSNVGVADCHLHNFELQRVPLPEPDERGNRPLPATRGPWSETLPVEGRTHLIEVYRDRLTEIRDVIITPAQLKQAQVARELAEGLIDAWLAEELSGSKSDKVRENYLRSRCPINWLTVMWNQQEGLLKRARRARQRGDHEEERKALALAARWEIGLLESAVIIMPDGRELTFEQWDALQDRVAATFDPPRDDQREARDAVVQIASGNGGGNTAALEKLIEQNAQLIALFAEQKGKK